jgi:para-aminobenzoate synthetase component 2
MTARILVVDNYDSFVFNLVQYLYQLGATCEVVRNDEIAVESVTAADYDGVLLSPGPGTPEEAGVCVAMVHHCSSGARPSCCTARPRRSATRTAGCSPGCTRR